MSVCFDWSPGNLPRPHFFAAVSPGAPEYEDTIYFGADFGDGSSDPVVGVTFEMSWRRPRPFVLDVSWPRRPYQIAQDFVWRRPRGDQL